jgi:leader peptidase (prepilin peptidase)/N-methyltransferase
MTWFLVVIAAVYGLILGSFVNAWAYRLAHDESIREGRSHCPHCGHQIRAYDNIPVVSWLLLRGRCRDCGAAISWRYPAGEALTAALFVGVVLMDGLSWLLIPHLLFVLALVLVSEVDLEIRIIPDVVILPVAAVGLPLMIAFGDGAWWQWPAAGLGAAGLLFLISEVYFRLRHVEGMGFGDVKLALCMGIYLGAAVVPALFLGFLSGAIIGVAVLFLRKGDAKTAIPFGPFLALGAIVALFVGRSLVHAYLGLAFPDH